MSQPRFPETLFVVMEEDDESRHFPVAHFDVWDLSEEDNGTRVATYKLVPRSVKRLRVRKELV